MATFIIGGTKYEAPVLNFKTLKKVWPYVESVQSSEDMAAAFDAVSIIVSAALERTETPLSPDEVDEKLLAPEIDGLRQSLTDLLIASKVLKLVPEGGDEQGEAPGAEGPSTEIGTDISPSLSPPVAPEGIGTE